MWFGIDYTFGILLECNGVSLECQFYIGKRDLSDIFWHVDNCIETEHWSS